MTKIEGEIKTSPLQDRVVVDCQYSISVFRLEDTDTEKDRDKEIWKDNDKD